jgi:DNA helicase HerA-like ATPase
LAILYEEAHGNKQIRDYCSSMLTRFKSLKERDDYGFLRETTDDSFKKYRNELLGIVKIKKEKSFHYYKRSQVLVIDLSSVEDEIVEVISCVIARIVYEALKNLEPRNTFPINLILEEAHRYISIDQQRAFLKANRIFEIIAKEGRKFGLFLMVSSQRPSELSKTVLSQCGNFIVHRIQNPEDLSHIRQMTPHISETILRRLPSIPTQHALVFGQAVNLPAMYKVKISDPLPKSDNNRISKNWFKGKDSIIDITMNQ